MDKETLQLKKELFMERLGRIQMQTEILRQQHEQTVAALREVDEALKAFPVEGGDQGKVFPNPAEEVKG